MKQFMIDHFAKYGKSPLAREARIETLTLENIFGGTPVASRKRGAD